MTNSNSNSSNNNNIDPNNTWTEYFINKLNTPKTTNTTNNNNNNNNTEVNMNNKFNQVLAELKEQKGNIAIVGVAALNEVFLYSLAGALTGYVGTRISGDSAGDMLIEKVGEVTGFSKYAAAFGITATALTFGGQAASALLVISVIRGLFPNSLGSDALRYIINDVTCFFTGKELLPYDLPEELPAHVMGLDDDVFLVWYQNATNPEMVGQPVHPNHLEDGVNDPQVNPMFRTNSNKGETPMTVTKDNSVTVIPMTNEAMKEFNKVYGTVKSLTTFSKPFFSGNDKVVVTINYANNTLSIKRGKNVEETVYNTRKYVVFTFTVDDERVCGVYKAPQALTLVEDIIKGMSQFKDVEKLIKSLSSKIFIDISEQTVARSEAFYGRRKDLNVGEGQIFADQQMTVEANKVSVVGIQSLTKGFTISSNKELSEFNGEELSAVAAYFLVLGQPVATDKNNKKYFIQGDGCRACGLDLVDGKLVTLNPIPRDNGHISNGAKVLNRIASHGFLKADEANLIDNNVATGIVTSNLLFALSNNNYTCGAGVEIPVFVSFGGFGLNNGIMETNAARDVKFVFKQVKNLIPVAVSLYSFDEEFRTSLGATPEEQVAGLKAQIAAFILEWAKANKELKANQVVKFNGVVVIANPFHFDISIADKTHITVAFGGHDFNGQVRSVVVKVKATVISTKKSPKVRGLTKKATAFPTNTVITKDGVVQDWTALLNHNTIKGSSAILDIIANDDEFINSTVIWNKGVLTIDGKSWTQDELIEWLENKAETYVIKRQISKTVADEIKSFNGISIIEENSVLYVVEEVRGFFGHSVMEIEVSTADENHGVSRLGLNEQQTLALAGEEIGTALAKFADKQLDNADLLIDSNDKEIPVFRLPQDAESLRSFFDVKAEFRTKAWMGTMAQKSIHGIRIEWDYTKLDGKVHTWSAVLPFGIFNKFGEWDLAGRPATSVAPVMTNDEIGVEYVSSNIIDDVFDFINVITSENVSAQERKSLFLRSNIFSKWVANLKTAKKANQFTKAGVAFHQKVVGDLTIGNKVIGTDILPVVRIHPNNPMVANKALTKELRAGEAVVRSNATGSLTKNRLAFLSRCPLPLFTAVVVEFDDTLDNSVIAVNPIVWIRSNLGDFDGDLGYLTDAAQFNFAKPKQCAEFNANYSSLFVGGQVATNAIKDAMAMGEEDTTVGADKPFNSLVTSWTEIANPISINELTTLASSVHNHYKFAVGKLYNVASALTQELGNKAFDGKSLTPKEVEALMQAWFLYEEIGLGGWSSKNEAKINKLESEVKALLKSGVVNEIRSVEDRKALKVDIIDLAMAAFFTGNAMGVAGLVSGVTQGTSRRRGTAAKAQASSDFSALVICAAANTVIGRKVQKGSEALGNKGAVVAQATRVIARKDIGDEANIFKAAERVGLHGCRFAKQIQVIGALRAQCPKN